MWIKGCCRALILLCCSHHIGPTQPPTIIGVAGHSNTEISTFGFYHRATSSCQMCVWTEFPWLSGFSPSTILLFGSGRVARKFQAMCLQPVLRSFIYLLLQLQLVLRGQGWCYGRICQVDVMIGEIISWKNPDCGCQPEFTVDHKLPIFHSPVLKIIKSQ